MSFFKEDAGQAPPQASAAFSAAAGWDGGQARAFGQAGAQLGYDGAQQQAAFAPAASHAAPAQPVYGSQPLQFPPQVAQQLQQLRAQNHPQYAQYVQAYSQQLQQQQLVLQQQQLAQLRQAQLRQQQQQPYFQQQQQQRMVGLQAPYQQLQPGGQAVGLSGLFQGGQARAANPAALASAGMAPGSLGQLAMRQQLYPQQHMRQMPTAQLQQQQQQPRMHPQSRGPAQPRQKKRRQDDSGDDGEESDSGEDDAGRGIASERSSRPRRAAARQIKGRYAAGEEDLDEEELGADPRSIALGVRASKPKAPKAPRPSPPTRQANGGGPARGTYAEADEEEASGSDADEDARRAKVAENSGKVAAMLTAAELGEMDDEVERVLAHRPIQNPENGGGEGEGEAGAAAEETDKWSGMEFWVKWKRWSYRHCSWDTLNTLSQLGGYKRVLNYCKRQDELERLRESVTREERELFDVERQMEEQLVQDHMQLERIVAIRKEPADGSISYLCKWKGLPYGEATWEKVEVIREMKAEDKVDAYQERQFRLAQPSLAPDAARQQMYAQRSLQEQPEWLRGGRLRDYQLDGLNWMAYSWGRGNNSILADEMGLGKTVQCVSMVGYLAMQMRVAGPFLVVVPLSTVPNWIKEFTKWLPQVNTVVYVGDSKSREVIRKYEFYNANYQRGQPHGRPFQFEVLLTTYELALKDGDTLGRVPWAFLVVDEAHRLKNNDSALYQELKQWPFRNKLLVTGTPLQNSIKELWALLHFLEPQKFPSCQQFEETHSLTDAEGVTQLHAELKPHLLRRVIKDVERSLPPKKECILRVEMTPLQKQYYKYILSRNYRELNKGSGPQISLLNIIIELKKCCNHPFLFSTAEEEFRGDEKDLNAVDRLVRTSGKMVLLDKLLTSLKQNGHRVLIFSQMVRALDIISDYMRLRGYQHQRLDGSTPAATRHQAMEHFNKPGSPDFAFLLSTRAGGLGINLATADTVIIFDSDWNPQNDLQAMSRAHRIGQTETVNIYRFLVSGTVEEDILQRAKQKMVLDHLVIQRMDTSGRTVLDAGGANTAKKMFGKDELAAILRFGAEELFKEDDKKREQKESEMLSEDLDSILARAEVVHDGEAAPAEGTELLNSFNVATFRAEEDDAAFWNRLIPVTERPADAPAADAPAQLGARSTRYRGTDDYDGRDDTPLSGGESDSGSEAGRRRRGGAPRSRNRAGRAAAVGPPVEGALARVDAWPPDCDIHGNPASRGRSVTKRLSRKDAAAFIKAARNFARVERMADIAKFVGPALMDQPSGAKYALWWGLLRGCEKVERLAAEKKGEAAAKDALLDWFGVAVKAQEFTQLVKRMELLTQRIQAAKEPERHFRLEDVQLSLPKWGPACGWEVDDDQKLLLGCYWYGIGHWEEMMRDDRLGLAEKLALASTDRGRSKDAKPPPEQAHLPKASHVETRALALLRKLQAVTEKALVEHTKPVRLSGRKRGAAAMSADDSMDRPELLLGEDIMINVKKLRVLQRKGDAMERQKVVEKTRKYLASVGDRIAEVAAQDRARARIWAFVSRFTENSMDGEKLERVYQKIKAGKASAAAVAGAAGADGTGLRESEDGDLGPDEAEEGSAGPDAKRRRRGEEDSEAGGGSSLRPSGRGDSQDGATPGDDLEEDEEDGTEAGGTAAPSEAGADSPGGEPGADGPEALEAADEDAGPESAGEDE